MSWQAYVDTSMLATGQLDAGAIYGQTGDVTPWATSPNFKISAAEMKVVLDAFKDKSDVKAVQSSGLHVNGVRYVVIKADDNSLYGTKNDGGKKTGILIAKTTQAILFGHYPDGVVAGNAANVVEGLAEYLKGVGY